MTTTKSFETVFDTIPGNGWLTVGEARLLWSAANSAKGDILEVGCFQGRSTCLLASLGRVVHAVDPFSDDFHSDLSGNWTQRLFIENIKRRGLNNVELHRMKIEDWEPRPVGFAYLDGDHSFFGTIAQIQKALECNPSTIAVHDVNDDGGGFEVKRACLGILGSWTDRVERLAVWVNPVPRKDRRDP